MTIKFFAASLAMVAAPLALAAAPAVAEEAEAKLTIDSPIEALMAHEGAREVVLAEIPGLDQHPAYGMFKGMSLKDVQPNSQGAITDEMLANIEAGLAELG